jgi:preprotein translocase subunit SecA
MMDGIKEEAVGYLFNLEVSLEVEEPEPAVGPVGAPVDGRVDAPAGIEGTVDGVEMGPALAQAAASGAERAGDHPLIRARGLEAPKPARDLSYSAPSEDGVAEVTGTPQQVLTEDPYAGSSRNALCPCGSGKKYKKCHGAPGGPTGLTTRVNG